MGGTARALAMTFDQVFTIELSEALHRQAAEQLSDLPNVTALQGHSAERLPEVLNPSAPTLYFLDGHWSAGLTAGEDDECPILEELASISNSHPDDCLVIDDAHLFCAPPPPPHDPAAWPTLLEVIDAVRVSHPDHHVTLLGEQLIATPRRMKDAVDAHGLRLREASADPPANAVTARARLAARSARRILSRG